MIDLFICKTSREWRISPSLRYARMRANEKKWEKKISLETTRADGKLFENLFKLRKRFSNSFAASEKFQLLQSNRSENIFHFLQLFVMEIPQPHFLSLRRMNHSLNGSVALSYMHLLRIFARGKLQRSMM